MDKKIFKRNELKYIISTKQMEELINILSSYMNEDKYFKCSIRNIYYDTPDYLLIRTSIEKPDYKEKLRIRAYQTVSDNDHVFIEFKKKYNKVVYKRREKLPYMKARKFLDELVCPNDEQITKEIEYALKFYKNLKPMIFLSYDRLAYIGKDDENLRITFDRNIIWRNYDLDLKKEPYGKPLLDDNLVMMEIKTVMGYPRWLLDYLGKNNIYKTSFSKYGHVYKELMNEKVEEIKYA